MKWPELLFFRIKKGLFGEEAVPRCNPLEHQQPVVPEERDERHRDQERDRDGDDEVGDEEDEQQHVVCHDCGEEDDPDEHERYCDDQHREDDQDRLHDSGDEAEHESRDDVGDGLPEVF